MDEQYLSQIYEYISSKDESYKIDVSFEKFMSSMGDEQYAAQIYNYLGELDPTYKNDISSEKFMESIGIQTAVAKKKDSVSASGISVTSDVVEEQVQEEPTFSWDDGSQPTTLTATPESITVPSDPTVKVETSQEVEERHRTDRQAQRDSLPIDLKEDLEAMEADEEDQFKILEEKLKQIDLTGETEETIVPKLNHLLGDYGFEFEQASIGSDAVKIIAPKLDRDGNRKEKIVTFHSLINKLEGGIEDPADRDPYEKEIADFIKENRDISIRVEQDKQKIINEKELDQVTKDFNVEAKEYMQLAKLLKQEAYLLTQEAQKYKKGVPGYEDYLKRQREHELIKEGLLGTKENLVSKGKKYDTMVGEYHIMRREGGSFFGQSYDMLKSSVGGGTAWVANTLMHQLAVNTPGLFAQLGTKEFKYGKEEKFVNPFSKKATQESRDTKEGVVDFIEDLPFKVLGRSSTKEYLEDYQQAELFSAKGVGNVWFSLLEFVPAAKAKLLGTVALSANYVLKEMQDSPEFDDVSEGEQMGVSFVIGSVIGVLENIGFKNVMQSKAFTKLSTAIASKVMLRNPATRRTFNEYVEQEVKSLMGKGALRMLAGGTAEFETGVLQEASEMSLKYAYNQMKGSDLFETPEDLSQAGYQILMGGIAEAMGGAMMSTPKALSYSLGTNDLSEIDDNTFKMFQEMSKDSKYLDFVTTKLKQQVVNQEITKAEMDKILTDYNRLNGAMQKMPDGINTKNKKQLLGLFMQHQQLKDNMKNTDDVFNKEDKKKLAQIENRIDAVLKENKIETEVDDVLNTTAEESKVFYAEKLEDIPEQHRDKAEKIEDDDTEISFRTNRFGLPIGKVKSTKVGEYFKYTLDGAEIEQTIEENTETETAPVEKPKTLKDLFAKEATPKRVGDVIGTQVTIDGKKGVLQVEGQRVIFQTVEADPEQEGKTVVRELDMGNKNDMMFAPLAEFGIEAVELTSIEKTEFEGKTFTVTQPIETTSGDTISGEMKLVDSRVDKKGRRIVKVIDSNKLIRRFTGDAAEQIMKAYKNQEVEAEGGHFSKKPPQGTRRVSESVSVIMGKSKLSEKNRKKYERIVDMARKAMDALARVLPDVKILIHSNSDTFAKETGSKTAAGVFDPGTNIIHINLPNANLRTVGHEVLHAILINKLKTDKRVGDLVNEMIKSIKKAVNPKVAKELEAFTKRYEEDGKALMNEEYIAELFGILSERANSLSPKAKNIIAEFIQKLRELFNLPSEASVSDQEVIDFLNTLALRVGQGQVIEEGALALLEDVDKKVAATKRKQKTLPPKIQKLKDEGMLEGIYDLIKAGEMELAEQVLKGAGLTMDEFMTEDTVIDMLKDSKGITPPEVLDRMADGLGGTYEAEKVVFKAHAKSFNRVDPETGEPLAVVTASGDPFVRLSTGQYKSIGHPAPFSLAEMYDSFDALLGEEYQEASYVSELSPALEAKIISGKVSPPIFIGDPTPDIRMQKGEVATIESTTTPVDKFLSNPDEDVAPTKEGYVVVYHKTTSNESAANIKEKGLLLSKKKDIGDPMDKMFLTKGRTDYSKKGALVAIQIPEDKLRVENKSAGVYSVIGDTPAEDILKVYNQIPYKRDGKGTSREDVLRDFFIKSEKLKKIGEKYIKEFTSDPTPTIREQKFDGEENYEKWKGENKELSGPEIQDAKTGEPIVAKVYHGTTHEFYEFDSKVKGHIGGHLGRVNYFTSDYQDANQNYQSEGGDITSRIETLAERIEQNIEDEPEVYDFIDVLEEEQVFMDDLGVDRPTSKQRAALKDIKKRKNEATNNFIEFFKSNYPQIEISQKDIDSISKIPEIEDVAKRIAEKELMGEDEKILDLYVKLNNPVVIGGGMNYIEIIPDNMYEDSLEDAAQEIAEENDITIEEAKEDYSYEIRERAIDIEGIENPLIEALQEAINENTYDYGEGYNAGEILADLQYEDEVDLNQLEKAVREGTDNAQTEEGEYSSSQIVADMFKNLGYDGIILTDVSQRFRNMGLSDDISHVHVFDEFANQIKLADGSNVTFDPSTPDIRMQKGELLAPNGKPSNLTPEQYKAVRTPEFKKWFGDWENDPENSSKVVDENGEPLVVYHGSPTVDIDVFDRSKSKRKKSGIKEFGTYFSTNKNLSELYAQVEPTQEYIDAVQRQIDLLNNSLNKVKNNKDYNLITSQIKKLEQVIDNKGEIYPVFLNLRTIETFDANAETNIEAWRNLKASLGYKIATGRDAMEAYAGLNGKVGDKIKVDGIEAKNIIDMGLGTEDKTSQAYKDAKEKYLGSAFLVFDSTKNAAKLADGSNVTFDPATPDIRMQKGEKPKLTKVYHGSGQQITELDDGVLFVTTDKREAGRYADLMERQEFERLKDKKITEFEVDENKLAQEEQVHEAIEKLGLKSKDPNWPRHRELNIHELLDPNFGTSLADADIKKVFKFIEEQGFEGVIFWDSGLHSLKQDQENIIVFNSKKSLSYPTKKDATPDIRMQKGDSIQDTIKKAKAQGYTDVQIKEFLIDQMGYTQAEADALFPKPKKPPVTKKKPKKKTKKSLVAMINEKAKNTKGPITKAKTRSLIGEAHEVAKLNDPVAVAEFVEKVRQIFDKSSDVQERKEAKNNRKNAKNKLPKQFGVEVKGLMDAIQKILSVDIALIPDSLLEEYNSIIGEFAKRVKIQVFGEDNFVQEYTPKVEALRDKVKKILENQVEEEVVKEKEDSKEDTDERKQNIEEILEKKKTKNTLQNKDEKNLAAVLLSVTKKDLNEMTNEQLRDLNALLSQIQRGYISTFYATKMRTVIEGSVRSGYMMRAKVNMKRAGKYSVNALGIIFAKLKSQITKKVPLLEQIRSAMTSDIDNLLGNFNASDIFNSTFRKLEKAYEAYTVEITKITNKINKVNELIAGKGNVFKKMNNAQLLSRYKIMASLLQDEFLANSVVKKDSKGNIETDKNGNPIMISPKGVASAMSYINGTIEKLEDGDVNDKAKAKILKKLKAEIEEKNGIKLSKKEQKAKEIIQEINNDLTEKFLFVAASRGESPTIYNNYIHHSAFYTKEGQEDMMKAQQKAFSTPSTKPGTKEERSDNKVISFDPSFSTMVGAKQTLLDYYMRQPIAEVRAGINTLKGSKEFGQRDAAIQLEKAFTESLDIVISKNLSYLGLGEKAINGIRRLSYYSLLASIPRAGAELLSNLDYVLLHAPIDFSSGATTYFYLSKGVAGAAFMNAVGSGVTSKNYSTEALSGARADPGTLNRSSFDVKNPMGKTTSLIRFLYENTLLLPGLGKTANYIAEKLIATPDKALARPLWFGTFFSELESLTKTKFSKKEILAMASGKSELLSKYKKEIEKATAKADRVNVQMSTSTNPFNTRLKDQVRKAGEKKDATALKNGWRVVNTYMGNFSKNEHNTSRKATIALMYSGEISRPEAVALLVAITTRMAGYVVLYTLFRNMFYPLFQPVINAVFGFEYDDEEEDETDYAALTGRQFLGAMTQLTTRRALGNVPYLPIGLATEAVNEKYLSFLRNDEAYDSFEHSIIYSNVSMQDLKTKNPLSVAAAVAAGPLAPLGKSAIRTATVLQRMAVSEKAATRERAKKEVMSRTIVDLMGNLGLLPFYKDIRKMVIKGLYESEYKTNGKGITLTKAQKKKYMPEIYKIEQRMEKLEKQSGAYKMKQKMKANKKLMKEQMLKQM